ncbi:MULTISPECIES: hypothetical protein [unclassified Microcoleus]|uniref:hypothetical protein n=1 Tax=unclassified Microcoleus TaxID=2642155 RepID=UPI002FCF8EF3
MEEGSSATDFVTDVTDVTDGRRKFGHGFYNGCNGCQSDVRRKKEEGGKKEEGFSCLRDKEEAIDPLCLWN